MGLYATFSIGIVALASISLQSTSGAQTIYCVVSPGRVWGETWRLCNEMKTWNEYLAQQHRYFHNVSNVMFLFLSGTHYMNRSLEANNTSHILFTGSSPDDVILRSSVTDISTPLNFTNFSNITVKGMNIELCTSVGMDRAGILYFSDGLNFTVHNARINNTCNGSEIYGRRVTNVLITHIVVRYSRGSTCGSVCLLPDVTGLVNITNSTFIASKNDYGVTEMFAFINFAGVDTVMFNSSVYIDSCLFICRAVLVANLGYSSYMVVNNVSAYGCGTASYQGGFSVSGGMGMFYVQNSTFAYFRIAMIVSKVIFSVYNSYFSYNTAVGNNFVIRQVASALSIFGVDDGSLYNVTFVYNGMMDSDYSIANSPGLLVYESSVTLNDCKFIYNIGHGLYSYHSDLSFTGSENLFAGNRGYEGAAMYLAVDDTTNIQYTQGMIHFQSNVADYTGGAILIAGMKSKNPKCPFNKLFASNSEKGLMFSNNMAESGGDNIYGGYLDEAIVYDGNNITRCIEVIRQSSVFNTSSLSSISSKPSRVCLCDDEHQNKPDCLNVFSTTEAYPGEDIYISVVAVGQTFGTSAGFVNAQLLQDTTGSKLGDHQKYQVVSSYSYNILVYNIYSQPGLVILVLTTEIELVQNYGNVNDVKDSIEQYNKFNHSFVPKPLLNFPVYINVTLKECPPGFKLSESPQECTCDKRILDIDGVKCLISNRQLERSSTIWIGKDNGSQVVLFSKYCPYNYCKSERVNIFNSSDLQCQMNHTGQLCGQCPMGTSLTLGTSQCKQCSNSNLYLLVPFAVSGVVLVIFLKLSDLTTAGGLINGLILYANLVKAGSYVYFPATSSIHLDFFRVFIDWLNLDLGIETCFFDGLTGYWKTWLQFVFPLYVWAIALSMILMARYNIRMTRLLGNNSVPVLATLFLLSYGKLFRVINTAMKFTILENENGTSTAVWSYDGSIDYFSLRHSILLIVAILVLIFLWLPYTCVLLFVQCLQRCSVQKINSFVSRMQPFLDAHCGPFKDPHRYWFGVLLIARAIPLLIGTVSSTNSDRNTILSTIAVIGLRLVFQSRVYRKLYVSISESLFLLNLLFLAGSALYTLSIGSEYHNSQEVFTTVLVGFVFLHFIVIAIFSTARHFRVIRVYHNWIPLHGSINNSSDRDT